MKDEALFDGFSAEKQAEYEALVIDRYGLDAANTIRSSKVKLAKWSEPERKAFLEEISNIEKDLADAMTDGAECDSERVREALKRHYEWVGRSWSQAPNAESYSGLADLYLEHPDFVARYEAVRPGFSVWLAGSIRAYARDRLV